MTIKIEKEGWIVSGDTPDELQAAVTIIQRALSQKQAAITAEAPKRRGRPPKSDAAATVEIDREEKMFNATLRFLSIIADSDNSRIASPQLAQILGLKQPRAVGSFARIANSCLDKMAIRKEDVYLSSKDGTERTWEGKAKIREAVREIRARCIALKAQRTQSTV